MKSCFAYIRVSTLKQGLQGVSLPEQKDAIAAYAGRNDIQIIQWFEERVTAAKRGRPVFTQMLKRLEKGEASGLVIHKIDRGARNLKDWADLGELIDRGIYVHFVSDNLDLASRGGRLSADIQAVVAADYIRNLREETRKGFYGRLKQGIYPNWAPLGYLDQGKGKPKIPDPATAPLIRYAFEEYASGRHSLKTIKADLTTKGLRTKGGRPLSRNGISMILNNPFYYGEIRIRKTNERFAGIHEPLISKSLFDRVQDALAGKRQRRIQKHAFVFSRLITCATCGYSLIGESQKGFVYYRCQTVTCPTTSLREEQIDDSFRTSFSRVKVTPDFKLYLESLADAQKRNWHKIEEQRQQQNAMKLQQVKDRLDRLTDAFLDGAIDKTIFEERRLGLLAVQREITFTEKSDADPTQTFDRFQKFLELAFSLQQSYEMAIGMEKRHLVQSVTSNRKATGKNLEIALQKPFELLIDSQNLPSGGPHRGIPRTVELLMGQFLGTWPMTLGNQEVPT